VIYFSAEAHMRFRKEMLILIFTMKQLKKKIASCQVEN